MCGRYTLSNSDRQEIGLRFEVELPPLLESLVGRFNAAPGQEILVVRSTQAPAREALAARWGLVPSWAEDLQSGYRMINARSETVLESRAYGPLVRRASSRCLIPADGFFEWTGPSRAGGPKRPVRFTVDGGSLFSMAGLVTSREWEGGELTSCTILTTEADRVVAPVHDRMPVILEDEAAEEAWITDTLDADEIEAVTRPLDPDRVSSRMASPWLNRVGAAPECPELFDPDWTGPGTLFG